MNSNSNCCLRRYVKVVHYAYVNLPIHNPNMCCESKCRQRNQSRLYSGALIDIWDGEGAGRTKARLLLRQQKYIMWDDVIEYNVLVSDWLNRMTSATLLSLFAVHLLTHFARAVSCEVFPLLSNSVDIDQQRETYFAQPGIISLLRGKYYQPFLLQMPFTSWFAAYWWKTRASFPLVEL